MWAEAQARRRGQGSADRLLADYLHSLSDITSVDLVTDLRARGPGLWVLPAGHRGRGGHGRTDQGVAGVEPSDRGCVLSPRGSRPPTPWSDGLGGLLGDVPGALPSPPRACAWADYFRTRKGSAGVSSFLKEVEVKHL